jgi:hypothetical protein
MSIPWQRFLLAAGLALALLSSTEADETEKQPLFAVRTTGGSSLKGAWRELQADWSVRLGAGRGTYVAGGNVLALRRLDVPLPPMPADDHLLLANGDRLPYRGLRLVDEKFYLRHAHLGGGKEVSLPLASVTLLWRIAPDRTLDAEKLRRRLTKETRTRDVICLRNGDLVTGVLTSLEGNTAVVEVEKRRVTVKLEQVAYIAFNTELADAMRPKGTYARLILTDRRAGRGGRISLTSASANEETLTGTTTFGARVQVPLRDIAALDLYQGRFVCLSDLKANPYVFTPFLDAAWPVALDGNVAEHDLLLDGSTYDKGVSLHSHSRLTYRLGGAYRRFETLVGLDDRADGWRSAGGS